MKQIKDKIDKLFDIIVEKFVECIDEIPIILKIANIQCIICLCVTFVWNVDIILCGLITGNWRSVEWVIVNIILFIYWIWCENFYYATKRLFDKWKR